MQTARQVRHAGGTRNTINRHNHEAGCQYVMLHDQPLVVGDHRGNGIRLTGRHVAVHVQRIGYAQQVSWACAISLFLPEPGRMSSHYSGMRIRCATYAARPFNMSLDTLETPWGAEAAQRLLHSAEGRALHRAPGTVTLSARRRVAASYPGSGAAG
jgi:hypothetical protein